MGLDEFDDNAGYVREDTTLGQRIMRGTVGLTLLTGLLTGLGYMHELGNEKVDAQTRERLTEQQMDTILEAARSETCEVIHPKLQRICLTEERALDTPEM